MRLSIGAILIVTVPETIIKSEWRGDAHGTMPKRSTSKREANVAIISIAQQASPKVTGQIEELRAQLKIFSVVVITMYPTGMLWTGPAIDARVSDVMSPTAGSRPSLSDSGSSQMSAQTGAGTLGNSMS